MALEHAILTSLLEKPASGYDLARRFDKTIGFFWRATHQQIYRVLGRMDKAGWIRARSIAQKGRLDKKVYTVGADGRKELARWLREPLPPEELRSDLGVKLRAAAFDDPACVIAEFAQQQQWHAARLAQYREFEKRDYPPGAKLSREATLRQLVLKSGIQYETGWLEFCREAQRVLKSLA